MTKVLLICAGGMSSSLMAKKTTDYLQSKGQDILIKASGVSQGAKSIQAGVYDLYLLSPQVRMNFQRLEQLAHKVDKSLVQVPAKAYVPLPKGIQELAGLIEDNLC